ncbi:hypothetical protein JB92DRAFT_2837547 [Gautieria morchelliformis]|nr:hypothetical protein JB92DRAFT_2837547 [Gautieria morchelliformis]
MVTVLCRVVLSGYLAGYYTPASVSASSPASSSNISSAPDVGLTTGSTTRIPVPTSLKTFINVAFSLSVPAPPTTLSPEDEARVLGGVLDGIGGAEGYFVPVVVSEGTEGRDKAGKPSLIFDAIINPSLKARMLKSVDFKSFVLEIILSQIESPHFQVTDTPSRSLTLSRTLVTPNIRYKGTPEARIFEVPVFGVIEEGETSKVKSSLSESNEENLSAKSPSEGNTSRRPLIQEISSSESPTLLSKSQQKPKGILKTPSGAVRSDATSQIQSESILQQNTKGKDSGGLKETEAEPGPNTHTESRVLDADPHWVTLEDAAREVPVWRLEVGAHERRILIEVPKFVRFGDGDGDGTSVGEREQKHRGEAESGVNGGGKVDVERARAEWRIVERRVIVYV